MRLRDGLGFGLQVVSGLLFAQLLIVLINPPIDPLGYLITVIVIDTFVLLVTAAVGPKKKPPQSG